MSSRLLSICFTVASTSGLVGAAACDEKHLPPPVADEVVPISFVTHNGWEYDGRIELPPQKRRRDWAVMMLGGGLGGSIDWLVPGVLTLDGKPTQDGDTIARALLDEGFVVMRWHAIRRCDPLNAADLMMMEAPPPQQAFEQANLAFEEFRARNIVPEGHVFLLGHSLGASRACSLLEEHRKFAGVVMLAGAALIPSDVDAAREVLRRASANPDEADFQKEGLPDIHEWHVRRLQETRDHWEKGIDGARDRWGRRWAADVLVENNTSTFLLVGALDERWLVESYLFTIFMREHRHPDYTWRVFDNLGHNLGREQMGPVAYRDQEKIADSRTGPIDPEVVRNLVEWIAKRAK